MTVYTTAQVLNRNIYHGSKKITNTKTNTVITNDKGNNEEVGKAVSEAKAVTNSLKLNSSNNDIYSSNSKSYYVKPKF